MKYKLLIVSLFIMLYQSIYDRGDECEVDFSGKGLKIAF
jgi:hypothetical protein